MSAYKVDAVKKIVTIDDSVKATAAEEKDIDRYVAAGYIIKHKSQKRAKQAAERAAADSLSNEEILAALKDNKEATKQYMAIMKGKGKGTGFFAAKKWYKDNFVK